MVANTAFPYLSLIVFVPLLGMVSVLLTPAERKGMIRWIAVAATSIPLALTMMLWRDYLPLSDAGTMAFVERYAWIPPLHVQYYLGADGLSVPLLFLNALLLFIAVPASWKIEKATKGYFALLLLLETGVAGVFCALDFFLFYVFWEIMLLPMYFLIGIWGGPRREYAAIKFFLYTLIGSVLMLVAMIAIYIKTGSFDILAISEMGRAGVLSESLQWWAFIAFFISFAIKIPVFPFHTWLPDAHVEAPTPISVILAGILLKLGGYGLLRISFPMLPFGIHAFGYFLAVLGMINILYGAFVAMAQTDFKKLVAYSSVSHMGYVLLGMAALTTNGLSGAALQMFNHGTSSAMLFLIVGVVYDRAHHREIAGFGGLGSRLPVYLGFTTVGFFAALGLPGLAGFISEALCLFGAFPVFPTITILSAIGIIITAAFLLWTIQRVFFGPLNEKYKDMPDLSLREMFTMAPLAILCIVFGVFPMWILDVMNGTIRNLVDVLR